MLERFTLWFTLTLTVLLMSCAIYLMTLAAPPPGCEHDCKTIYGGRSCEENAVYDVPRCLGPIMCEPYECTRTAGPTHVVKGQCLRGADLREQHVTYVRLDCNGDFVEDTSCEAWHSCLKPEEDIQA